MQCHIRFFSRSSFNYKFEEPLYNLDTEPRFFKKTFETLSGFLTHTFSSDDATVATKTKEVKTAAKDKTHQRPVKQKVRNPLENLKPVKFPPASAHNYQEVSQHGRPSPDQNYKPNNKVSHLNQKPREQFNNNSWKPSQRLVARTANCIIVRFLLFQIQCH